MQYRRANAKGGTYFFTVNLAQRDSDLLVRHVDDLRNAIYKVKAKHPFSLLAMVVLPEHLHAIWRLPHGDANYPLRWSLIKAGFSRRLEKEERIRKSRSDKRERGIWQRRYWEHQIRDEADLKRHVDYIHYNPVKHGWVNRPIDWRHSTLHGYVARGTIGMDWGGVGIEGEDVGYGER
ncbi:REP-associated tyrosine transposase [Marinobacter fonticola]|uniref:REP-associated tyrosine transposase n=1 Tax=Marinobacter fonticola TaxID=2603215 RepID=UPI0011E81D24|nr:transposase [Marinobacter fonticola]